LKERLADAGERTKTVAVRTEMQTTIGQIRFARDLYAVEARFIAAPIS
jgi:hypothetical protein